MHIAFSFSSLPRHPQKSNSEFKQHSYANIEEAKEENKWKRNVADQKTVRRPELDRSFYRRTKRRMKEVKGRTRQCSSEQGAGAAHYLVHGYPLSSRY